MNQQWPNDVINAIRRGDLVLVVGAGVSTNSVDSSGNRPQSWKGLIERIAVDATRSSVLEPRLINLLEAGSLLEAAEYVAVVAHMNGTTRDVQARIRELTDGRRGGNLYMPNAWHDALLMFDPNIIVTTNYDRLIERASKSGYQVHTYDSNNIGPEVRRGDPILLKIHGTVDDLDNIILTQSDYSRLHVEGKHALDVVQALFLTRVVLFVGYSINDPDIRLLLQNTVGGRRQTPAHYILTPALDDFQKQMMKDAFGVTPIEYDPESNHEAGLEMLTQLGEIPRNVPPQS